MHYLGRRQDRGGARAVTKRSRRGEGVESGGLSLSLVFDILGEDIDPTLQFTALLPLIRIKGAGFVRGSAPPLSLGQKPLPTRARDAIPPKVTDTNPEREANESAHRHRKNHVRPPR